MQYKYNFCHFSGEYFKQNLIIIFTINKISSDILINFKKKTFKTALVALNL